MPEYTSLAAFESDFQQRLDAAQDVFLNELQVECEMRWKAIADQRLQATAAKYTKSLRVTRSPDEVTITVPAGIPSAVDAGTNGFGLAKGFFSPASKTENLERAPGNIRWKTISAGGKKRHIPLDGGWAAKAGGDWQHPGIKARNITKTALRETMRTVMPNLKRDFCRRVAE